MIAFVNRNKRILKILKKTKIAVLKIIQIQIIDFKKPITQTPLKYSRVSNTKTIQNL